MKPEHKRIARRWLIGLSVLIIIALFGERAGIRAQQVGWHVLHRNELRLAHHRYQVPLRWLVYSSDGSFASLVDLPLRPRHMVSVMISEGPKLRSMEYWLEFEQQMLTKNGHFERVRRFDAGGENLTCIEGTQQVVPAKLSEVFVIECRGASGISSMFVGDRAQADAYYKILSSAQPI